MMACSQFCTLLSRLHQSAPALDSRTAPTLHGLALFAAEFEVAKGGGSGNAASATGTPVAAAAAAASTTATASPGGLMGAAAATAATAGLPSPAPAGPDSPAPPVPGSGGLFPEEPGWSEVSKGGRGRVRTTTQHSPVPTMLPVCRALMPGMLSDLIRRFSPRQAAAAAAAAAGGVANANGKLSMAQVRWWGWAVAVIGTCIQPIS